MRARIWLAVYDCAVLLRLTWLREFSWRHALDATDWGTCEPGDGDGTW